MSQTLRVLMAGGGTGGHVIPALAVAEELRRRGHEALFVGTKRGYEAKLVPRANFPIEWIEIGGLKRVGLVQTFRTVWMLPMSVLQVMRIIGRYRPHALFSMGGYVAGPAVLAAWLRRVPIVVMEPNAMPGFTNRRGARFVSKALLSFGEAASFFRPGTTEITGVPVRREFFQLAPKSPARSEVTILVTGGSLGSRTLNRAIRESWPLFAASPLPVRLIQQTGVQEAAEMEAAFAKTGLPGQVSAFLDDMPAMFAQADLLVCRAGASAVAELAAAGKPAILVPYPFAADDHQLHNAEAMQSAGAARLVRDSEMNGQRLFDEVRTLVADSGRLTAMSEAARSLAKPHAAERAADALEQVAAAGR